MKLNQRLIGSIVGLQLTFSAFAAENTETNRNADIEALQEQIRVLNQKVQALEQERETDKQSVAAAAKAQKQDLDDQVRALDQQRELDREVALATAKTQPIISLGANGFSFGSPDSNFVATLHALVQVDSRTFLVGHAVNNANDAFLLRRARPIIAGTVFHDFDFNLTPDFGGSTVQILDAYVNCRFDPVWQIQAGKFKSPVGLEQLQPDVYTSFNERSLATDLVPNRDIGLELHDDLAGGGLSYALGVFDGASDYSGTTANTDSDDGKAVSGRLFAQPWKKSGVAVFQGLGFGAGGSYEYDHNGTSGLTTGYTTDGQQKFFTYGAGTAPAGTHWRISPQGYYYYGPFSVLGEYVISDQRVTLTTSGAGPVYLRNTAWEISAGWVLTGEAASYNGVTPLRPFRLHGGGWGAWQMVARYADLDVDDNAFKDGFATVGSASEARAWSVGLNWYLNRDIRCNTSFSHTTFALNDGAATAVTRQPEDVLFTRIQLAF